jgi:hypothetical protein
VTSGGALVSFSVAMAIVKHEGPSPVVGSPQRSGSGETTVRA